MAAFVAVSASMDDLPDRAEAQLESFLQATEPLPHYLDSLSRESRAITRHDDAKP